jgi:hypothetical protein
MVEGAGVLSEIWPPELMFFWRYVSISLGFCGQPPLEIYGESQYISSSKQAVQQVLAGKARVAPQPSPREGYIP